MARQQDAITEYRRDLGTVLSSLIESANVTKSDLARATNYDRTSISHICAGRQFPDRDFWVAADRFLNAGGKLVAGYAEVVNAEQRVKREELGRRLAESLRSFGSPEHSWGHFYDDELDALELARRVAASDVGDETLSRLESSFDDLARAYPVTAPSVLLPQLRRQLSYIARLLDARKTLAEHRRLLILGGWLSLLSATVHIDLKQQSAATARLRTAASLAKSADYDEIRAWCFETEAWRVLTDGDYRLALELSLAAQELAPAGSSVAIQSTAQEGRAWARLGQAKETYDAIGRVHALVGPLKKPEQSEHHYRYDPGKSVAYTATTLAWVGDVAAEEYAREVITRLKPGDDVEKWPRRVASANLDLALALIAGDRLEEACHATGQAIASGRIVPSNHWRAAEVVAAVEARQLRAAKDLREAFEEMRRPSIESA
ncbi:helix-turn-helix domain-containing protein [Actinosynnema sp. CA-248983]